MSVRGAFCSAHNSKDLKVVESVIADFYPEYVEAFEDEMNDRHFYVYNMLMARKEIFDAYYVWLFDVLFHAEKQIVSPG